MKKILVTTGLLVLGVIAFAQKEENGTIYIKHPYIDIVNKAGKAYEARDVVTLETLYSDTATFWSSGMPKFIPIAEAYELWMKDFDGIDSIKQKTVGYPDFLQYKKDAAAVVQSWWTLTGKSKKTGEPVQVQMVMFDDFNKDGKIIREYIYGDFSKWGAVANGTE